MIIPAFSACHMLNLFSFRQWIDSALETVVLNTFKKMWREKRHSPPKLTGNEMQFHFSPVHTDLKMRERFCRYSKISLLKNWTLTFEENGKKRGEKTSKNLYLKATKHVQLNSTQMMKWWYVDDDCIISKYRWVQIR